MKGIKTKTVGEIVKKNFLASNVFNKHGIDFFCEGSSTLAEACQQQSLNITQIEKELHNTEGIRTHRFDTWEIDYLIDYILNHHHYYVWVNIPVIKEYSLKVARAQGAKYPATIEANRLFKELASELEDHMHEEEYKLFPYIKQLIDFQSQSGNVSVELIGQMLNTIQLEHQHVVTKLKMIVKLLANLRICHVSGSTEEGLLNKVKHFQKDLFQHIHLENNLLFPKAVKLEAELTAEDG